MGEVKKRALMDWISFWNSDHPIYVNARHRDVHYRGIADDVSGYVSPGAAVLDYGCGEAVHADRVAAKAGQLILCEAAPNVRAHLAARFSSLSNIAVKSPDEVAALPPGALDLIVMHSVAQYLSREETDALFAQFRRLLKPDGLFILGDVIPPQISPLADVAALLRFAAANGFLIAAFIGLVRTTFSDYPKLRAKLGLTLYEESAMTKKLEAVGFSAERAQKNIGHSQARMTFLARPR
jgi:SAM-dependent methyltransferase